MLNKIKIIGWSKNLANEEHSGNFCQLEMIWNFVLLVQPDIQKYIEESSNSMYSMYVCIEYVVGRTRWLVVG